jgi:7-keto-8-aminopelargonate synthetase-like enzyme
MAKRIAAKTVVETSLPLTNSDETPLGWLEQALAELDRQALRRKLTVRRGPQRGDEICIDDQHLANFGSNDYLGLAADGTVVNAARRVLDAEGFGSGASPLVTGRGQWHARLERELASLAGKSDAIFSDELNHASIIDGCRLSGALVHVYRHCDASHLASLLASAAAARRKLIVTDALFSMQGDLAPLGELTELARRHRAMVMVDEAHATGVFGSRGRGVCEQIGIEHQVHVRVGTLSKALGGSGGFVTGSQMQINAAAALAAVEIVRNEPQRRTELLARAAALRDGLRSAGVQVGRSESQIIPVILGAPDRALAAAAELRRRGFLVPAIRPPSVPDGQSLLRISVTWRHSPRQLDDLAGALIDVAAPRVASGI